MLLTAAEAAARMRCHERTIRRMVGRGELPAHYVAGRYLIREADLPVALPPRMTVPPPRPRKPRGDAGALVERMERGYSGGAAA